MIGDRMDTDIVAGIESGLRTLLVLTGVTAHEQVERFPIDLPGYGSLLRRSRCNTQPSPKRYSKRYDFFTC